MNKLFYGDNLDVMRKYLQNESVDLCYIDPPFNSKRNYNQIYNNIGKDDVAQAQAFIDTWTWDEDAIHGLDEILSNKRGLLPKQCILLINGLEKVLGKGSLLAYLIHMTLRIAEIHRILKPTGSFYLHCDSSASHYLKIVLDAIFCSQGGEYHNEIIWKRSLGHNLATKRFDSISDVIFFYSKSNHYKFYRQYLHIDEREMAKKFPLVEIETGRRFNHQKLEKSSNANSAGEIRVIQGKKTISNLGWVWSQETFDKRLQENPLLIYWTENNRPRYKIYADDYDGKLISNIWDDLQPLSSNSGEALGYPTQKPEALLERILKASSNENDVVFDAYCGCGTSVAVAQKLNRQWIGIDITYQSISLIMKRLEDTYGKSILENVKLAGIPEDFEAVLNLVKNPKDKARKEFEKWAVLTFSDNRAIINEKRGGDGGIDGTAFVVDGDIGNARYEQVIFSVKSNETLTPAVVRELYGTMEREKAAMGYLLTLYPMDNLVKESKKYGLYKNNIFQKDYPKIEVISVNDILKGGRMRIPASQEIAVVKSAELKENDKTQLGLF